MDACARDVAQRCVYWAPTSLFLTPLPLRAGIRLCKAQRHRYKHLDLGELERKLQETQSCRVRLIVTDGVFSMDGDVAPLRAICDLADKCVAAAKPLCAIGIARSAPLSS